MLEPNRTRPRNSGPTPMSSVRKKKNADSLLGVARQRKMKSAGSQTVFCLTADHRAAACCETTSFGLAKHVKAKARLWASGGVCW